MSEIIYTNHLIDRLYERKISKDQVYKTIKNSDENKKDGDRFEYVKKFGKQKLTVITKLNDRGDYIVLSAWVDPPNSGTQDEKKKTRYFENKKAGPIRKIFLTILNQLGA